MFDLIKLTENTYYFDLPTKIGVYKLNSKQVMLIDSGLNAKTAGRVLSVLEKMGLEVSFIINTHSHTDHAGGNRFICEKTGCKAYATPMEGVLIENPDVEATLVYGGYPCKDFRKKFMNTEACRTFPLSEAPLPCKSEVIPLSGHTAYMVGFKTPDDVYFIADSVNSKETLDKAKICYIYDIDTQLNTLEKLKKLDGRLCVPAHANPTRNVAELAQLNIDNILEIRKDILVCLKMKPKTTEELTAELCIKYGLKSDFMTLVMMTSGIRSHLSSLRHGGVIDWYIEDYRHYWKVKEEA